MMSICLQSMVDELMVKKSGGSIRKVGNQVVVLSLPFVPGVRLPLRERGSNGDSQGSDSTLTNNLYLYPQMLRRRVGGTLRRSDSQQAVKSPPLLVSVTPCWYPGPQACFTSPSEVS